ncbi:MAG: sodium/solute symporter [Elusimicrobia bacterium]|nr:sodium/solute symporter [Elusimicrobiota bacterium]
MTTGLELGWLDGTILLTYVVTLASIGWWAAHKTAKTTEDYFLASRSIHWLVTTASFFATCTSALTFVGTPAEGYSSDYRYVLSNGGDILACFMIAGFFIPHFQKLRVTSIYEAVERRFGRDARTLCSFYFLLTRTLASTVRVVAIAKVLEVVTGGALTFNQCMFAVVGAILLYTTMGGGRAIAWTDLMQFILLYGGAAVALVYIVQQVPGGLSGILEAGKHAVKPDGTVYNKFNFLEMAKPENIALLGLMTVWGFFNSSAVYGTDQDMVQRLLACNDPKKARWSLLIWGLAGIPITMLFLTIGVGLYAYVQTHPQLIAGMTDNDHIFPRFILTTMPHGLRGLMFAAIAAAAMGSADSALASLATVFVMDFYKPFWGKNCTEEQIVKVSKQSFVAFGVLFIVFGLTLRQLDSLLWLAFKLISFTYGPLLGLFSVAILTDWNVNARKVIPVMVLYSVVSFTIAMFAWHFATQPGAMGFWVDLHKTYWRFWIIGGALIVPAWAWLIKEPGSAAPQPA